MLPRLMIVVLLLAFGSPVAAQAPAVDGRLSALGECLERSDGTNTAWGICGGAEVERQEQRLNAAWKRVSPMLDPQSRADLLAEQRAWISFKDKSCLYLANGQKGRQGQVLEFPACRAAVVADRAGYLESLVRDLESAD